MSSNLAGLLLAQLQESTSTNTRNTQVAIRTYLVYVPVNDNTGKPFPAQLIDSIRRDVIDTYGGLTQLPVSQGFWYDESSGKLYGDYILPWIVSVPDTDNNAIYFASLASRIKTLLGQESVYIDSWLGNGKLY